MTAVREPQLLCGCQPLRAPRAPASLLCCCRCAAQLLPSLQAIEGAQAPLPSASAPTGGCPIPLCPTSRSGPCAATLTQVIEEAQAPLSEYYRHISKGAWPFSTRDHGWPISDCSSEGLKAALALAQVCV